MRIEDLPKLSEIRERNRGYELYREEKCESEPERLILRKLLAGGYKPEKQYQIGKFFADFAFPKIKLAIEYDGRGHEGKEQHDVDRHIKIRRMGWSLIRARFMGKFYRVFLNEGANHDFGTSEGAIDYLCGEVIWKLKVATIPEKKLPNPKEMLLKNSLGSAFDRIYHAHSTKRKIIWFNPTTQ